MADPSTSAAAAPPAATGGSSPQIDPLLGRTINNRFKIISQIARGGMGKVYKAEQAPLGRICAVKVLNPNYAGDSDPEFHKRFFLEASIASKLSHPNTVTIFDYGKTDDEVYYMAMEYLEGHTLHRLIRDVGGLDAPRVMHIIRQICRSLREAHAMGVIHRDLKPANIYLIHHDEDVDFVKVLDFGLVKNVEDNSENLTQTGLFMGSPKYMAPEQIRGERVTSRTDVYALGVVMYEMLSAKVPFDRGNSVNTLMAHVSEPVPKLHDVRPDLPVPPAVEEVVYKCLEKRPEDRYASMDEMLQAIKRASALSFGGGATGEYSTGGLSGEMPAGVRPSLSGDASILLPSTGLLSGNTGEQLGSGATPLASTRVAEPTETKPAPSRLPLYLGAAAVLLLGSAAFIGMRNRGNPAQGDTGTNTVRAAGNGAPTTGTGAGAGATNAPPTPLRLVHVSLTSVPTGAEVFEGTDLLGRTPLSLEWSGDRADPNRSHTFSVRLTGYREDVYTLSGTHLEHASALVASAPAANTQPAVPAVRRPPPPGVRPRPGGRPGGTGDLPPGFRDMDDWPVAPRH